MSQSSQPSTKLLQRASADPPQSGLAIAPRPFVLQAKKIEPSAQPSKATSPQIEGFGHNFGAINVHRNALAHPVNQIGLPDSLKTGIETLSGLTMDDVKVHYNSSKPARLHALAYTQGTNIYIGSSQEKFLAHEAWHVVQQKQGRVKSTMQALGVSLNNDRILEKEADIMGAKALRSHPSGTKLMLSSPSIFSGQTQPIQRIKFEDVKVGNNYNMAEETVKVISKQGSWITVQLPDGQNKNVHAAALIELSPSTKKKSVTETMFQELEKGRGQFLLFTIPKGFTMPEKGKQAALFKASVKRKARSFEGERVEQALRWVATVFFHLAINQNKAPEEVQAGLYKDQIIISANTQIANSFLDKKAQKVTAGDAVKAAAEHLKDSEQTRISRHAQKVIASIRGLNETNNALKSAFKNSLIAITEENPDLPGLHAERRIAEYINKKENDPNAYLRYLIVGVKRPCLGCFLKMFHQKESMSPKYPPKSVGPLWSSKAATYGINVDDVKGGKYSSLPLTAVTQSENDELTVGYGTDSDSELEEEPKAKRRRQDQKATVQG